MRILVADTYYPEFLRTFYRQRPGLAEQSYDEQIKVLLGHSFGTSDFYSRGLEEAGRWKGDIRATDLVANCAPLQRAWAKQFGVAADPLGDVLYHQIRRAAPDVLYVQDLGLIPRRRLDEFRKAGITLAAQCSCPMPSKENVKGYDVIFTSFPHYVPIFKELGVRVEYVRLAFDPVVLNRLRDEPPRGLGVSFVGGMLHKRWWEWGNEILETLARRVPEFEAFGYGAQTLPPGSELRQRCMGEAWGLDMYRILVSSRIVVNRHGEVAWPNANNMRLFEATGCGALLVTDQRGGLDEMFEIGREVVTYSTASELCNKVRYYLNHPDEAERIAKAGQKRTAADHTYAERMRQEVAILKEVRGE